MNTREMIAKYKRTFYIQMGENISFPFLSKIYILSFSYANFAYIIPIVSREIYFSFSPSMSFQSLQLIDPILKALQEE